MERRDTELEEVVENFARVLHDVWWELTWDEVELVAERTWSELFAEKWSAVQHRVRSAWAHQQRDRDAAGMRGQE